MRPALKSQHAALLHSSLLEPRISCGRRNLLIQLKKLVLLLHRHAPVAPSPHAYFQLTLVVQTQICLEWLKELARIRTIHFIDSVSGLGESSITVTGMPISRLTES